MWMQAQIQEADFVLLVCNRNLPAPSRAAGRNQARGGACCGRPRSSIIFCTRRSPSTEIYSWSLFADGPAPPGFQLPLRGLTNYGVDTRDRI